MTVDNVNTIGDLLQWVEYQFDKAELFFGHGTDNPWDEAVQLVLYALQLPLYSGNEVLTQQVTHTQTEAVKALVARRIDEKIPLAYLTNCGWFAGLPFYVDERVLVPRSPLAELVEQQFSPWLLESPKHILDLCTGSGCIGIACAYAFPEAQVVLSDISGDALAVANINIGDHGCSARVSTLQSDLFERLTNHKFDLIVSNPPYVDAKDLASMPDEFRHEPAIGLGSGTDGLDFTRRLLSEAGRYLNDGGTLIAEVGNSWQALDKLFPELPFTWLEFERGGHGVFYLTKEELAGC